jgi:hypothetical protein
LFSLSGFGFSGWAIVILSIVIVVFVISVLMSPRKVQRVSEPLSTVTVQILNGCGDNGAAEALARAMMPGDSSLMYDIIEKSDTKLAMFEKTTVVDRRGSHTGDGTISEKAKRVAAHLGIDPKDVVLLRLEENILGIDVTVIAGEDYYMYIDKLKKAKEAAL